MKIAFNDSVSNPCRASVAETKDAINGSALGMLPSLKLVAKRFRIEVAQDIAFIGVFGADLGVVMTPLSLTELCAIGHGVV